MQIDEVLQQTLVYEVDHEKVVVVVLREEKIQFRAVLSKSFFQSSLAGESVNLKRTKRQIKILNLIFHLDIRFDIHKCNLQISVSNALKLMVKSDPSGVHQATRQNTLNRILSSYSSYYLFILPSS